MPLSADEMPLFDRRYRSWDRGEGSAAPSPGADLLFEKGRGGGGSDEDATGRHIGQFVRVFLWEGAREGGRPSENETLLFPPP